MAGKTLRGMISYIKQILWRRRLLVALFADLAFFQLAVIKSADLKYQLHLFKGAINKKPWRLLKEPASSGCLSSLRTDWHRERWGDPGWCWARAAQHLSGWVFHMLTDLSFMLQDTRDFFIKRKPLCLWQIALVLLGLDESLATCLKPEICKFCLAARVKNEQEHTERIRNEAGMF